MVRTAAAIVAVLLAAPAAAREWTDKHGHSTSADFVRIHEDDVILMRGKKVHRVPFAEFCPDDQEYIRTLLAKKGKEHLVPVDAPLRTWTDNRGRGIEAQLVRVDDEQTVVLRGAKKMHEIAFDKFSAADRAYLRAELAAQGKADSLPPATADELAAAVPASPPPAVAQAPPAAPAIAAPPLPSFSPPPIPRVGLPGPPGFGGGASAARERMQQHLAEMEAARQRSQQESAEQMRRMREESEERRRRWDEEQAAAQQRREEQRRADQQRRAESQARAEQAAAEQRARLQSMTQPATSNPPVPQTLAPSPAAPQFEQRMYKYCEKCQKELPDSIGAGDHCPYCGVFFDFERTLDGQKIQAPAEKRFLHWITGGGGVALVVWLIVAVVRRARS